MESRNDLDTTNSKTNQVTPRRVGTEGGTGTWTHLSGTPYVLVVLAPRDAFNNRSCNLVDVPLERKPVDILEELVPMLKADRLLGALDECRMPFKRRVKRRLCRCCVWVKSLSVNEGVYSDILKCEAVFRPLSSCRLTRLSVSSSSLDSRVT